ncbi:archaellin/type IV pilin N-terminal domain-containing protein [Salinigranum salinum]|uniref:archaellin/type IV pilin N-terminal domain-containing protein n=1 Tax=Salinigranum salinum TaxID=1364937 RepID=UPI001260E619|nr:archaellin/type IV pilin N-terminal domain-containing protein [Salinigranum salinum]
MFEDKTDRGQVGIGTLIVFIAMVLVAAIAAGVLVNTAGFLQENAEQTGQEAQSQVSDRLNVVSSHLNDTDPSSDGTADYNRLNLTVKKAAGSGPVDLTTTTVTYLGPSTTTDFQVTTDEIVSVTPIKSNTLRNESDRVVLSFQLGTDLGSGALSPGDDFEMRITTASGATTVVEGRLPSTAEADGLVAL